MRIAGPFLHIFLVLVGLSIDARASIAIYWSGGFQSSVNRADLNDLFNIEFVLPDPSVGDRWGIDVSSTHLYTFDPEGGEFSGHQIIRTKLNGSSPEALVNLAGASYPRGLRLDLTNDKIYWADFANKKITRSNLDGSSKEDVVAGLRNPYGLALDIAGDEIYWSDVDSDYNIIDGKIFRSNVDGTNDETLVTGIDGPSGVALDLTAQMLYWTERGSGKIWRSKLDGSSSEVFLSGLVFPNSVAIGDDGYIYYTEQGMGVIGRATKDGVTEALLTDFPTPRDLVLGPGFATPVNNHIPEPSSLALWGIVTVATFASARRRSARARSRGRR